MSSTNCSTAELRWLVPAFAGQRVGIAGEAPALVESLTTSGVTVLSLGSTLPENKSLDHLVVPELNCANPGAWLAERAGLLKPGGCILIGVINVRSVHYLAHKLQGKFAYAPVLIARLLREAGFEQLALYGVHSSLACPRYFVSLDRPGAALYFFTTLYTAYRRSGAVLKRIAPLLIHAGLQTWLFHGLIFTACRSTNGGSE